MNQAQAQAPQTLPVKREIRSYRRIKNGTWFIQFRVCGHRCQFPADWKPGPSATCGICTREVQR